MWGWPATTITMSSRVVVVLIATSISSSPLNCTFSKHQYQLKIITLTPPTPRKILLTPTPPHPPHPHLLAAHAVVLPAPRTRPNPPLLSPETAPTPSDLTSSKSRLAPTLLKASPPTPGGEAGEFASSAATEPLPM